MRQIAGPLTATIFALVAASAHASDLNSNQSLLNDTGAEVVEQLGEGETIAAEITVIDEAAYGVKIDQLSDEDIFGAGGLLESDAHFAGAASDEDQIARASSHRSRRYARRSGKRTARRGGGGSCVASGGMASYYGKEMLGKGHSGKTASGERFNPGGMTAAHRFLKLGSIVQVSFKGRSVTVRINDRGPFHGGRVIDLSSGAARRLGMGGTARVAINVVKCG